MFNAEVIKPLGQRELAIINVGANRSHSGLFSPLYEDGTFFFMPIPEEGTIPEPAKNQFPGCQALPTYAEFLGDSRVVPHIHQRYLAKTVHNDPEFVTFTYGDNPEGRAKARAANLTLLGKGDLLFFFAGLTAIGSGKPVDPYRFYFVGFFEIIEVLRAVSAMPSPEQLRVFGQNAHIKRGQTDPRFFRNFWVWKGSSNSQRFQKAVPFDRELGAKILLAPKGMPYDWPTDKADVQLLGTRARASRRIMTQQGKRTLLERVINTGNKVPLFRRLLDLD